MFFTDTYKYIYIYICVYVNNLIMSKVIDASKIEYTYASSKCFIFFRVCNMFTITQF